MSTKPQKKAINHNRSFSAAAIIMLISAVLFILPGVLIFAWYGFTYIPVRQTSAFPSRNLTIQSGGQQCTLVIPSGQISIRRPQRTAVGSSYSMTAEVSLEEPFRFTDCSSGLPNWNINLEAQTALVGAAVHPFAAIRQPAFDREKISFDWTFTPEEKVSRYTSHLWLRTIVSQQSETVERWDLLVRDFPMENMELLGQPTIFWLIGSGFSVLIGLLLFLLFLQKRKKELKGSLN